MVNMKIISIGLYKPLPIKSGVDSYISSLLNPLGKNHDVLHYYFCNLEDRKGYYPSEITFKSEYLESNGLKNLFKISKLLKRLRPEFLLDKRTLENIKADIVFCDTFTFHVAKEIAKKNKSPIILIKHNIEWKYIKDSGLSSYIFLKVYENHIFKKVDAIITISMKDYEYISKYTNRERIFYLPSNIDTLIFKPEGPSYPLGNEKLNLLFYGSLDRPMNIYALKFIKYKLIPFLEKENLLSKIRINIFGSGIPPKALKIENDKNINYLGNVEDPGRYIRGADLLIVPIKNSGGMKIRLMETLFCGKPIIATPEASDGIPNNLKKFIYIEKDVDGFVKIIRQFLEKKIINNKIDQNILDEYVSNNIVLYNTFKNYLENKSLKIAQ